MSFARNLGMAFATVINAAVKAQNEAQNNHNVMRAESAEADKWESRRLEVHAAVDRAVNKHRSEYSRLKNENNERLATRLRFDANTNARNRSESLMEYTEREALRFEQHGY